MSDFTKLALVVGLVAAAAIWNLWRDEQKARARRKAEALAREAAVLAGIERNWHLTAEEVDYERRP